MPFEFYRDPLPLDGDLSLVLSDSVEAPASGFGVPMYTFEMRHAVTSARMGRIRLRVGWNETVIKFAGQIGYLVEPSYRGHHYAERACRLIAPLARRHEMDSLWITCQPDNVASRRTLERLGAQLVATLDVPEAYPLDAGVIRQKACYCWQPRAVR